MDDDRDPDQVQARLRALEQEVRSLRSELARELRTRRLVVEDDQGVERVIASGDRTTGSLQVRTAGDGASTAVEVYATDDGGSGRAEGGVLFLRAGHVTAQWRAE